MSVPGQAIYGASKAAVKLLSEALYAELKDTSVGVTVVFPGATKTNIAEHSGVIIDLEKHQEQEKIFPMLLPEEVAKLVVQGIENNSFQVFTGKDSRFMNLLYRLSPKKAVEMIAKQMGSLLK